MLPHWKPGKPTNSPSASTVKPSAFTSDASANAAPYAGFTGNASPHQTFPPSTTTAPSGDGSKPSGEGTGKAQSSYSRNSAAASSPSESVMSLCPPTGTRKSLLAKESTPKPSVQPSSTGTWRPSRRRSQRTSPLKGDCLLSSKPESESSGRNSGRAALGSSAALQGAGRATCGRSSSPLFYLEAAR